MTSLAEHRKRHNQLVQQQSSSVEERLASLEADQLRIIDQLLLQDEVIEQLEDRVWRLLRLVKRLEAGGK